MALRRLRLTLAALFDFVRQAAEKALSGLVGMATPLISLRRSAPSSTQVNLIPFFKFSYSCVCDMRDSSLACLCGVLAPLLT